MCGLQYNVAVSSLPHPLLRHSRACFASAALAVLGASCSSPTSPAPVVVDLIVQTISPDAGPVSGGTEITIRGAGFAAGSVVFVGGRAASDITVRGSDTIVATTPASTVSGGVDISVTLNGRTGTLPNAFRYDVVNNTPPTIKSIAAQGTRTRQPANFADYGETIRITAVVEDAQSAPAQLKYDWVSNCGGTFSGNAAQVNWTAPVSLGLPQNCTIELIVSDGPRIARSTTVVRLHNSAIEVGDLALQFLTEFANNNIPAATTVRNFASSCPGKASELSDVADVRKDYRINTHKYGDPSVTVAFGGTCKGKPSDACVRTPVEWQSTYRPGTPQQKEVFPKGVSFISAIYREARWWLCDSLLDDPASLGFWPMR
jgi:hypothetical protein